MDLHRGVIVEMLANWNRYDNVILAICKDVSLSNAFSYRMVGL